MPTKKRHGSHHVGGQVIPPVHEHVPGTVENEHGEPHQGQRQQQRDDEPGHLRRVAFLPVSRGRGRPPGGTSYQPVHQVGDPVHRRVHQEHGEKGHRNLGEHPGHGLEHHPHGQEHHQEQAHRHRLQRPLRGIHTDSPGPAGYASGRRSARQSIRRLSREISSGARMKSLTPRATLSPGRKVPEGAATAPPPRYFAPR